MQNPFELPLYSDPNSISGESFFDDSKHRKRIRHGFIRKVYGILTAQLAFTMATGALFVLNSAVREFVQTSAAALPLLITSFIGSIVCMLLLLCVPKLSQSVPTNYILLMLFTGFESFLVGFACTTHQSQVVLQAVTATAVIVAALTLFSFQTTYDFTSFIAITFYLTIGLSLFAIFTLFFRSGPLMAGISVAFALLTCVHLVIDTQLLIGNGKVSVTDDDYIVMVVMLYIDILNLFYYLLQILQYVNRN